MSLINDALKRARQSQQVNIPGGPPLRPVEPNPGGGMGWILLAVIILLVAASFFIGMSLSKRKPAPSATAPEISPTQQIASVTAEATAGVPISAPASNAPSAVSINNQTASISNSIPEPPPQPPQPKLQGIIFTPPKPWAIVNNKTVYVGDSVGDFTVKEISRNAVTLENADGSEKKLVIGQ
jgi:hypothetical protein